MKHSLEIEGLIHKRKRKRMLRRAGIALAVSLCAAFILLVVNYVFDFAAQEQAYNQAERVRAQTAFSQWTHSIQDAISGKKAIVENARRESGEDEARWRMQQQQVEEAAREAAKQEAIEAARQKAIEAARDTYEKEVAAIRERRSTDFSDTFMVGDSVMEYATAEIYAQMPGAVVQAEGGRSLESGPLGRNFDPNDGVLDVLRAEQGVYSRYVIGTGNNDLDGLSSEAAEEIIALAGEDAEVYFITQVSLNTPASMEATNATIAAVCESHDNVFAIDWNKAVSGREAEMLYSDGVHPLPSAVVEYTTLVRETISAYNPPAFNPETVDFDPASIEIDEDTFTLIPELTDNIMGKSIISAEAMAKLYTEHGAHYPAEVYSSAGAATILDFCKLCIEEANAEGVRAEVLFAQAMHETAWLQFGNQVSVEQCNFGGLGAVNSGGAGEVFPNVRTGLRAQVQHLKAYASEEDLVNECVDTRFELVTRACAPTVFDLGGRWAWPGDGYGDAIMAIIQDLYNLEYNIQSNN